MQRSKKKDDLTRIVLERLKRVKSKEYLVKMKRNEVYLPRLDMEGKSCWRTKGRTKALKVEKSEEHIECVIHKVLKKKNRLKQRYQNIEMTPVMKGGKSHRN